MKTDVYLL